MQIRKIQILKQSKNIFKAKTIKQKMNIMTRLLASKNKTIPLQIIIIFLTNY